MLRIGRSIGEWAVLGIGEQGIGEQGIGEQGIGEQGNGEQAVLVIGSIGESAIAGAGVGVSLPPLQTSASFEVVFLI